MRADPPGGAVAWSALIAAAMLGCAADDGRRCGGPDEVICPEGEYCDTELDCSATAVGVCRSLEALDEASEEPVCGCDGMTHANERRARALGAGVYWRAACDCSPMRAWDSGGCIPLLLIAHWDGAACETPWCRCFGRDCDRFGGGDGTEDPVARCEAAYDACPAVVMECGSGRGGCPRGTYCDYPGVEACTGVGRCVRGPSRCDGEVGPAVGCDGRTYDSVCEAYRNGTDWRCERDYCRPTGD